MIAVAVRKEDQNEALFDPWSIVHFAFGLAFGLVGLPFVGAMGVAIAYDVLEHAFEKSEFGQRFFNTSGPESGWNIGGDLLLFAGGWMLGDRYNATGSATNPLSAQTCSPARSRVGVSPRRNPERPKRKPVAWLSP